MKVYEVECGAVITLAAQDMRKAALHGAAVFKDNPHLIYVRAVHERNLEPAWEDPSPKNSQKKESMLQSVRSSEVKIVWTHQVAVSRAARVFETLRSLAAISPPPELARSQRVTRHISSRQLR
jgi:hypothetical protein